MSLPYDFERCPGKPRALLCALCLRKTAPGHAPQLPRIEPPIKRGSRTCPEFLIGPANPAAVKGRPTTATGDEEMNHRERQAAIYAKRYGLTAEPLAWGFADTEADVRELDPAPDSDQPDEQQQQVGETQE